MSFLIQETYLVSYNKNPTITTCEKQGFISILSNVDKCFITYFWLIMLLLII